VKIPEDKPYIILKGQAKRTTEIVWDDHDNIVQSPTFTSLADNIIAKSISFRVRESNELVSTSTDLAKRKFLDNHSPL